MQPLDEESARQLAVTLATKKLATAKLVDAAGKPVPPPSLSPDAFRPRQVDGRWHLSYGGPAGAWAEVSFDARGQHESVEVGFAIE